jgi:RNA polymerase sigma-70 factor (ECF subfamily)
LLDSYRNYLRLLAQTWLDSGLNGKVDQSDMVQETLLKAHQRFEQFQGTTEAELATWLRSILARHLADVARRYHGASRQIGRERSLEDVLGSTSLALGKIVANAAASPSEMASKREAAVVLADALADLPDDYRDVIMWISLEEQDWETVAERMGRSAGAVRMLWARALKQLRPLIQAKLKG